MNRFERVQAAIEGKEVDRVPVSVWMHFSDVDQDPGSLADAQIEFNEKYDYDFIKMMPFGLYSTQDWGNQVKFYCRKGEEPIVDKYAINSEDDYLRLEKFAPTYGTWGKQLQLVKYMAKRAPKNTPFIMTLFSPYTTLNKMAGPRLKDDILNCPEKIEKALEVITATTVDFAKACVDEGVSGFFFATQSATSRVTTEEQFLHFCRPYDERVINVYSDKTPFNVLHVHGDDIYFDLVKDYPVNCLNWHDRHTEPSLKNARKLSNKCFVGGICEVPYFEGKVLKYDSILLRSTPDEIINHVREAIDEVDGKALMVAPGCVADPATREENLYAVRKAVEL